MLGYVTTSGRGESDRLLADLAARLMAEGVRVLGAVQRNRDRPGGAPCDMELCVLGGARIWRISQRLGPHARGCRLDPQGLEQAVGEVAATLAAALAAIPAAQPNPPSRTASVSRHAPPTAPDIDHPSLHLTLAPAHGLTPSSAPHMMPGPKLNPALHPTPGLASHSLPGRVPGPPSDQRPDPPPNPAPDSLPGCASQPSSGSTSGPSPDLLPGLAQGAAPDPLTGRTPDLGPNPTPELRYELGPEPAPGMLPDLVILNKFGKQEIDGRGFRPVIAAALLAGLPVLTAVNARNLPAFDAFAQGLAHPINPDPETLHQWCLAHIAPRQPA